jgi:hypothetical protein
MFSDIRLPKITLALMTTCKNCGTEFEGKFCSNCSQKANTHRFTIGHFGHDFLHALTHTDKGILFLMKELFVRPGKVALEYNAGKRKKYFNPITYLLIMLAVQIFAGQKTKIYDVYMDQTEKFVNSVAKSDKKVRDAASKALQGAKEQQRKVLENNKIVTFVMLPILALLTWLFFRKSGHNYAENIVLNVMILAQQYLIFILMCVIPFLIVPSILMPMMYLYLLVGFAYSFYAYRQFFNEGWGWIIGKGLIIQIVYVATISQISKLVVLYL